VLLQLDLQGTNYIRVCLQRRLSIRPNLVVVLTSIMHLVALHLDCHLLLESATQC
jgi:hypothetical protein